MEVARAKREGAFCEMQIEETGRMRTSETISYAIVYGGMGGMTNYAYACFCALAKMEDTRIWLAAIGESPVLVEYLRRTHTDTVAFSEYPKDYRDWKGILRSIERFKPDVFIGLGWSDRQIILIAQQLKKVGVLSVCMADTPWLGTIRQVLRCLVGRPFIRKTYDVLLITGPRGYPVARLAGYRHPFIWTGLNSGNAEIYGATTERRLALAGEKREWPASFIFVGRFVEAKNLPRLIEAYRLYQGSVSSAFKLVLVGDGPMKSSIRFENNLEHVPWCGTSELAALMQRSGALILPSTYEAWGVVAHEAACAGLPLLLSTAVGAADDLLKENYNGRLFDPCDVSGMAAAMKWMHEAEEPWVYGARSYQISKKFSPKLWAESVRTNTKLCLSRLEGNAI